MQKTHQRISMIGTQKPVTEIIAMPPLCCTLNVDDTLLEVEALRQLLAICLVGIIPDKEHLFQII